MCSGRGRPSCSTTPRSRIHFRRTTTWPRIELLTLLASQAAISLENARLYADLHEAQAYLAEAQRLSTTGSFGWKPATGVIVWSEETHRIFGLDPATKPTVEFILGRAHPEDRDIVQQLHDRYTRGDLDDQYDSHY